jgi:hypothetical protein
MLVDPDVPLLSPPTHTPLSFRGAASGPLLFSAVQPCVAGFYCPVGSTSSRAFYCGGSASVPNAAAFFCPEGSGAPSLVGEGNYSVGSPLAEPHRRSGQVECPAGRYCVAGVAVSYAGEGVRLFC